MLTKEQLEKLTTPRLLAYLHSWLTAWESDKEETEWKEHHKLIKSVLARREHIEKGD